MGQEDFFSKSKETLSAIATAFQLVTPEQAETMDKLELALLLDNEQRKANEAEVPKAEAPEMTKDAPKAKAKKSSSKKKTQAVEEEKTPLEKIAEMPSEVDTEETIHVVEKKAPSKRGKKTAKAKEEVLPEGKEETSEASVKEEKVPEEKADASSEKGSGRKKKKAKEEVKSEEAKPEGESAQPEISSEEKTVSEVKPEENKKEEKKSRGKKKKSKEVDSSDPKNEEKKEESSEETKKEEPKKDEPQGQEKTEKENNPSSQQVPFGKKNKKGRHRSVEIRPAGEPEYSQTEGSSEDKGAQEGENTPEPPKPQIEPIEFVGVLEIVQDGGYGFVRRENYLPSPQDVFVPTNLIRRFGLRIGDQIRGFALPKRGQEKNLALSYITTVNDVEVDKLGRRPHFERLTPIYPDERFRLETGKQELSTRIIDLVSPIGKGQRGMIVSPPKAGKTILLQKIANAITQNSPNTKLIVLLIDERPEEVTDMQRSIKGEVVYSTFDKKPENHTRVTELVLERAMRLVEMGEDVVILLDSMTRLARAYNLTITPTGRTLSGGLDPGSLYGPKRFFGAARNIENGGSLTIVATSLIETGSRMDEVIFEEFKGTGNMEVYLDRKLSEKRIFPAIDINKSGTRREDLLMSQEELDAVWTIRKAFSQMETAPVTETIIGLLLKTNSNDQFVRSVKVSFADKEVFDAMRGAGSSNSNN